jgi:hypothetical protein
MYASMTGSGSAIYGIFNHFPDDVFLSKSHCFHWKGVIEYMFQKQYFFETKKKNVFLHSKYIIE